MMNNAQSMLVCRTTWNSQPSFKMIPLTSDCPFNEVIFDSTQNVLAIVSKEKREKPHMMHRLDDKGRPIEIKNEQKFAEMRVMVDSYYEYYIEHQEDIQAFVKHFAVSINHDALGDLFDEPKKKSLSKKVDKDAVSSKEQADMPKSKTSAKAKASAKSKTSAPKK